LENLRNNLPTQTSSKGRGCARGVVCLVDHTFRNRHVTVFLNGRQGTCLTLASHIQMSSKSYSTLGEGVVFR
jgi:hypothetical protein